jgi:hypothetical protein
MNVFKLIFIVPIIIFNIGCSTYKPSNNDDRLLNSIGTEKFKLFFKLCNKKEDTIFVYNNLNDFKDNLSLKIDCNKTVQILKSNIKIDVNSSSRNKDNMIVLYKYDIIGNKHKLFFIETATNATLTMVFDKKNKLISSNIGVF